MLRRLLPTFVVLMLLCGALFAPPVFAQDPVEDLNQAFREQLIANEIVTDPTLAADVSAIRAAVRQAAPHELEVRSRLEAVIAETTGDTQQYAQAALMEVDSVIALAGLILAGPDDLVVLRHEELVVHGGVALTAINLALLTLGAGPSAPAAGHRLQPGELHLPEGYRAEIVANGLNFVTALAVGEDGNVYVTESGYSYGNITTTARVLQVATDGVTSTVATGFAGPLAGIAISDTTLYASHRGKISAVDLTTGGMTDIITGLPSLGDHFNENIAIGPDGKLYIGQGTATNSGVVGPDNYFFGWLQVVPEFHDIPCRDLTLLGRNYTTGNPLTEDVSDTATTGAYLPFGTPSTEGQVVSGSVPCTGAVLRANLDGSGLEVYADGLRNPYGVAFHPDGRLFITENGPDDRGSRPVGGPDNLYEVVQGGWYGWPDFYGGVPVNDPSRKPETHDVSQPVLMNPPPLAGLPLAELAPHSVSNGLDFSHSEAFAPIGTAFIAQFGDLAPVTSGGVEAHAGHQVVMVSPAGDITPFLTSATDSTGEPFLRATDAAFDPTGAMLYVTHFGDVKAVPGGIAPRPGTGALIRITRAPTALTLTELTAFVSTADGAYRGLVAGLLGATVLAIGWAWYRRRTDSR